MRFETLVTYTQQYRIVFYYYSHFILGKNGIWMLKEEEVLLCKMDIRV